MGQFNEELDLLLSKGWTVKSMCPMPSSCCANQYGANQYGANQYGYKPQCLVIVEKKD